jgi:NAD/NADP transhydrogenase beta subunit
VQVNCIPFENAGLKDMVYRLLTDLTVTVHVAFLIFVVAGGFLARRYRWLVIPHLLAAVWGIYGLAAFIVVINTAAYSWAWRRRGWTFSSPP